jgi:hypothetical protein
MAPLFTGLKLGFGLGAAGPSGPFSATGLLFWYDTTLHSSQQQIFDNATLLGTGVTIPASQYVYMTWRGVVTEGALDQLQDDFGVSVTGLSSPYLVVGGVKYPTIGSYNSSELYRMYFKTTPTASYTYPLNSGDPDSQWGVFSTGSDSTPDIGWGSGGDINYDEGSLGV